AGLTVTPDRQKWVKFTRPYHAVTQQLIYNHNQPKPGSVDDLVDSDILVIAGSSHAERLQHLRREHPALNWDEQHNLEMIDLIEMVHRGEIDFTVVDSNAFDI